MSILVPLNDCDYLGQFVDAGADEFYGGFIDLEWSQAFGLDADLNRMSGFGASANFASFDEMLDAVCRVKETGSRIFVPFNSTTYTSEQIAFQEYYFDWLARYGADGVILSQPEQIVLARRYGLEPVVSTAGGVYNRMVAEWFASSGAGRIILPRDLTLDEIDSICSANRDIEYEAFLMLNGCRYSDSHCLCKHGRSGGGGLCAYLMRSDKLVNAHGDVDLGEIEATSHLYCGQYLAAACGLCSMWRLLASGVTTFKVVGRANDPVSMVDVIHLVNHDLSVARDCGSHEEFLRRMRMPDDLSICENGMNCYYPEARYGE